jgi:hypothetical protein
MEAICKDCQQDMKKADTCVMQKIQLHEGGKVYLRSTEHFDEPDGRCHDCGIKHDGFHHYGCNVERCPACGGQLISCECQYICQEISP